jgi:hypothetical protein
MDPLLRGGQTRMRKRAAHKILYWQWMEVGADSCLFIA